MNHLHSTVIIVALTAMIAACAEAPLESSSERLDAGSAASRDYLQDCLARIPKDATQGQRDVAQRTCARDVTERTTTVRGEEASSGTQGDTLQACIARIPKGASSGQHMIAEQSCERDESNRRSVQDVPGR